MGLGEMGQNPKITPDWQVLQITKASRRYTTPNYYCVPQSDYNNSCWTQTNPLGRPQYRTMTSTMMTINDHGQDFAARSRPPEPIFRLACIRRPSSVWAVNTEQCTVDLRTYLRPSFMAAATKDLLILTLNIYKFFGYNALRGQVQILHGPNATTIFDRFRESVSEYSFKSIYNTRESNEIMSLNMM